MQVVSELRKLVSWPMMWLKTDGDITNMLCPFFESTQLQVSCTLLRWGVLNLLCKMWRFLWESSHDVQIWEKAKCIRAQPALNFVIKTFLSQCVQHIPSIKDVSPLGDDAELSLVRWLGGEAPVARIQVLVLGVGRELTPAQLVEGAVRWCLTQRYLSGQWIIQINTALCISLGVEPALSGSWWVVCTPEEEWPATWRWPTRASLTRAKVETAIRGMLCSPWWWWWWWRWRRHPARKMMFVISERLSFSRKRK